MDEIKHLIILMMENRSFDHYLGALGLEGRTDIEGLPSPLPVLKDKDGNDVPAWPMDGTSPGYADPPHEWDAAHADYNGGANDGFVQQYQSANPSSDLRTPVGYYTRATLPVLYSLADEFTVCDHWFSSVLSSTWPNRKYLISGQRDADQNTGNLPPAYPGFKTTPFVDFLEDQADPDPTGGKLTWKSYFSDLPFLSMWYRFAASHVSNFAVVADFARDCREDRLPTVSLIDPAFSLADDHPSHDPRLGEKFIGLIVDALTNSDSWASSALVILYDENGGFFDHVAPPDSAAEDSPLGFRVPAIVVSPYSRKRFACKTVYDHTSVMKSISERWSVDFGSGFGSRWPLANSMWNDCFDFTQTPRPMGSYSDNSLASLDWGSQAQKLLNMPRSPIASLLSHASILPELKALDARAPLYTTLASLEQQVNSMRRSNG